MIAAEYYMHTLDLYDNSLFVAVGEGQELTIGVKKSTTINEDWAIFDDFSLTFYGNSSDAVDMYMANAAEAQSYYNGSDLVVTRQAGLLAMTFETYGTSNVQHLNITGPLNATDLATLKKMASVRFLDLSNATLQEASLPDEAFTGMGLVSVALPPAVTKVGKALFKGCNQLAAIQWNTTASVPKAALEGVENPNLLLYVQNSSQADGATEAGIQNVISNNRALNIVLTDAGTNNNFYCPRAFTAQNISYTHQYGMQTGIGHATRGWEALSMPFDVKAISHETNGKLAPFAQGDAAAKPFWLYKMADDGFTPAATIDANVPYIVSMPNNSQYGDEYIQAGKVTFSATNTIVPATRGIVAKSGSSQFKPAFQRTEKADTVFAINKYSSYGSYPEGSIFLQGNREVRPFEAYITLSGSSARFVTISEFIDGEATAIPEVSRLNKNEGVKSKTYYNLQGQRVATPRSGIYVVDGKKYVAK